MGLCIIKQDISNILNNANISHFSHIWLVSNCEWLTIYDALNKDFSFVADGVTHSRLNAFAGFCLQSEKKKTIIVFVSPNYFSGWENYALIL